MRASLQASLVPSLLVLTSCGDATAPEPNGLKWGSGASGAFVEDTIPLVVFYREANGDPIGDPRPRVSWTSSNPAVMSIVSDSLAVAMSTGSVVLTARTLEAPAYNLDVGFEVVPRWTGR